MTGQEFGGKLIVCFPVLRTRQFELDEIAGLLEELTEKGIARLWHGFRDDYEKTAPPTRPYFVKLAERLGLERNRPVSGLRASKYALECGKCGRQYPFEAAFCPCGECTANRNSRIVKVP